ncbi:MAG: hypothetical protein KDC71_23650, partial [Acidobacteria bacterium]|nr:hypothetical protein [Acidobacteriota bacterium]
RSASRRYHHTWGVANECPGLKSKAIRVERMGRVCRDGTGNQQGTSTADKIIRKVIDKKEIGVRWKRTNPDGQK